MNPSASDWILKFLNLFDRKEIVGRYKNEEEFYQALKSAGFIYGISVSFLPKKNRHSLKLTREELTKVNLFHSLLFYFFQENKNATDKEAILNILTFYTELEKGKTGFFQKFSFYHSPAHTLENILSARLQEANTLMRKSSLSLLTYALVFLDVLAYKHWLRKPETTKDVYRQLEEGVLNYCFYTLKSKKKKSKYDTLLIELFENSNGYFLEQDSDPDSEFLKKFEYLIGADALEKKYILDMCCLTIWEDFKVDETEYKYLLQIMRILKLPQSELFDSLNKLSDFAEGYPEKIVLFEYSNPIKKFYKQSASTVKVLIIRNKDRLARELEESGELVLLLGQSTMRDLSSHEKRKVKHQLLEICKTIPSLTIFLLPGGSILLPLLVKFIPKLLPTSFQDNKIK